MSFEPKSAMSNMKHESLIGSILHPYGASFEHCSIKRDPNGSDRLRHQGFPGRIWFVANLPAAHALCAELRKAVIGAELGSVGGILIPLQRAGIATP